MNNATIAPLNDNTCTKCFGSGKVGSRRANGVCFRCNGMGFIPQSAGEADFTISRIKLRDISFYAAASTAAPAIGIANPEEWLQTLFSK